MVAIVNSDRKFYLDNYDLQTTGFFQNLFFSMAKDTSIDWNAVKLNETGKKAICVTEFEIYIDKLKQYSALENNLQMKKEIKKHKI